MNRLLQDLRIVEISAFVAAPLGGMTMAQMGAEVIRIDPIGGGIDFARWPVTDSGASLYWAGLNKAKRSVALALDRPEGRDLARALVTAPGPANGPGGGILLTNLPPLRGLDYASLKAVRPDVVVLRLTGNRDGSAAVDYTVNAASGFPLVTGQDGAAGRPVNHVLPAWDLAAGLYLATALLAAERHRARTGGGQEVVMALSDVMLAALGHLGYIGDAQINGHTRPAIGNDLYGSFGRDFATADGRRVMIIALTPRQWRAIGTATGLADKLAMIGAAMEVDLTTESGRYEAREAIAALLARWCARHSLDQIRAAFAGAGVLWGPFQSVAELVADDPRCSEANPLFATVEQPGIGPYLMPGLPLDFGAVPREPTAPAPRLGEHTEPVLREILGLSPAEIARLHAAGIVAGPRPG
ncbi:MAG: CoA transferase [Alphaproteobacteria bacterium]|nr:CoA transferase [Alphaproteobacteria bacterium]